MAQETPIQRSIRLNNGLKALATTNHTVTIKEKRFPRGKMPFASCSCGFESAWTGQWFVAQQKGITHLLES